MQDSSKFMLLGLGVKLFAQGWGKASLEQSITEPPGSFKQLDAQQSAQALKVFGLVGDGFFWYGAYKTSPKLTIGLGVVATALVYAPKIIAHYDPKGWEEAKRTSRAPQVATGFSWPWQEQLERHHQEHEFREQHPDWSPKWGWTGHDERHHHAW